MAYDSMVKIWRKNTIVGFNTPKKFYLRISTIHTAPDKYETALIPSELGGGVVEFEIPFYVFHKNRAEAAAWHSEAISKLELLGGKEYPTSEALYSEIEKDSHFVRYRPSI